ncbi:hypothetical protein RhiirC2_863225 [Rhizophagus irregularis]|uniref:Uncharacterized protein n=1 Tax=Rhizophagus irregularis TaxID=588596 RepID=A0A2N1NNB9_9GLOM|nr:hypothetical protein RhiirC2_863225 [Rhizophagus irregularis]
MAYTWLSKIILKITLPYMAEHGQGWSKTAVIFKEGNQIGAKVKLPKYKNSSLLACQNLIKLVNFQLVAFIGVQIHIYDVDLKYNRLYRMYLVADVAIPTQKFQFISLVSLLEALYTIKDSTAYKELEGALLRQNYFEKWHIFRGWKHGCKSKEIVSFWDSILEREKRHAIKEYDYKILEQVRSKHVSIGGADVARVQRENAHSKELAFSLYKR